MSRQDRKRTAAKTERRTKLFAVAGHHKIATDKLELSAEAVSIIELLAKEIATELKHMPWGIA